MESGAPWITLLVRRLGLDQASSSLVLIQTAPICQNFMGADVETLPDTGNPQSFGYNQQKREIQYGLAIHIDPYKME